MSLAWILVGDTDKPRHESHVEKRLVIVWSHLAVSTGDASDVLIKSGTIAAYTPTVSRACATMTHWVSIAGRTSARPWKLT
jgi:hypothetical protein